MTFFNVMTVDEASGEILKRFKEFQFKKEEVALLDSLNRVLGEDIYSDIDVPEFDRSTVDGYAILSRDSYGATDSIPTILDIVGEVLMGEEAKGEISSGQAMYVPTGGMIPEGADGMIMIENTEKLDEETLLLNSPISKGENLIYKGDDIGKGNLILEEGTRISPEVMGVLAALACKNVTVFNKPKFYIISTGDEIIGIDERLEFGKIRDINSYTLFGEIENLGGKVVGSSIIGDDFDLLKGETEKALKQADIVLLSGGSSVGTLDFTKDVIDSFHGEGVFVHGISVKPGKPTIIGEAEGKLVFGLPGHPVSSIIVFKALVERFVKEKIGVSEIPSQVEAVMDFNFPSTSGRLTYQMVNLEKREGEYFARPNFGKSSMISLLKESDGYILIGKHEEGIYKGERRRVFLI